MTLALEMSAALVVSLLDLNLSPALLANGVGVSCPQGHDGHDDLYSDPGWKRPGLKVLSFELRESCFSGETTFPLMPLCLVFVC